MHLYHIILTAIIPVFLVMATGFVMHRRGSMAADVETGMMRVTLNLFIPCLITLPVSSAPRQLLPSACA